MVRFILLSTVTLLLLINIAHSQIWNETDSAENTTEMIPPQPFVYYGRYHERRSRREYSSKDATSDLDALSTVLSILPLDRLGAIIGQIMATGIKEMLNPNVGKKIINVLENQAPSLLTSLFTNVYSTFRGPVRPSSTSNTTMAPTSKNANRQLRNSSLLSPSPFMRSIRRPASM